VEPIDISDSNDESMDPNMHCDVDYDMDNGDGDGDKVNNKVQFFFVINFYLFIFIFYLFIFFIYLFIFFFGDSANYY
jgi:hypothetical protein